MVVRRFRRPHDVSHAQRRNVDRGRLHRKDYEKAGEKLLTKLQKAGVDPHGFGLRFRAMHPGPDSWQKWQEIYPTVQMKLNADIKIEGTGLIK